MVACRLLDQFNLPVAEVAALILVLHLRQTEAPVVVAVTAKL
jgi:hypothetical protein